LKNPELFPNISLDPNFKTKLNKLENIEKGETEKKN